MSTRTFKIGNAEIFQDKPNQETNKVIEIIENNDHEKAYNLVGNHAREIALMLLDKSDADLSVVLKSIVKLITKYKKK